MASATDLITVGEAIDYLQLGGNEAEVTVTLERFITAGSQLVDNLCGPVVNRTVTDEAHDGGDWFILPRLAPVFAVSSVVEYDGTTETTLTAETNAVKPSAGYIWETDRIIRRSSNFDYCFARGRRNVLVTYTAGRGVAAADKFKAACLIIVKNMWTREQGHASNTFGDGPSPGATFALPNAAFELIRDDIKPEGLA